MTHLEYDKKKYDRPKYIRTQVELMPCWPHVDILENTALGDDLKDTERFLQKNKLLRMC